jgi:hypothetical protein
MTHSKHPQRIHQLPITPRNLPRNLLPLQVPLEERPVGLALEEEMDLFEGAVRVGVGEEGSGSREERGPKSQRSPNTQSDEGEEEKNKKKSKSRERKKRNTGNSTVKRNETKRNFPIHHTHDQPLYVVGRKNTSSEDGHQR